MRATIALLERSLERDVGAPLWEPAPAGDLWERLVGARPSGRLVVQARYRVPALA